MRLRADLDAAGEGTFRGTLSHPWWEVAGRLTMGLWLGITGLVMTIGALYRIILHHSPYYLTHSVMAVIGAVMAVGGILSARGRFRVAGYVTTIMVTLGIIFGLFGLDGGAAASSIWRRTAEYLLPAAALGWIVIRARGAAWGFHLAPKVAAVTLLAVYAAYLPTHAGTLGASLGMMGWQEEWMRPIEIGQRFPKMSFVSLDGVEVSADEPGVLYVVNFWATWCAPCREELPRLWEIASGWGPDDPAMLLAVNTEDLGADDLRDWIERNDLAGLTVVKDPQKIQDMVGAQTIPFTLLVRDRTVLARHVGFGDQTLPALKKEIEDLLSERRR